jgi:hypothetical protein
LRINRPESAHELTNWTSSGKPTSASSVTISATLVVRQASVASPIVAAQGAGELARVTGTFTYNKLDSSNAPSHMKLFSIPLPWGAATRANYATEVSKQQVLHGITYGAPTFHPANWPAALPSTMVVPPAGATIDIIFKIKQTQNPLLNRADAMGVFGVRVISDP